MVRIIDHLYILATIVFTVYSQLIVRWQIEGAGPLPDDVPGKTRFVVLLLVNPWMLTAITATFAAGVSWMLTMTRFELSYAYPFVALNFALVLAASVLLFQESWGASKLIGTALVILGIIVISRG